MAKADIWMPLYIGDYLADTTRLTTEQHGAYLLLIMDYWRNGPPPNDAGVLAQITRMSVDAWSNAQAMLMQFFSIKDGMLVHERIDREMTEARRNQDKATAKAKAAAGKRWGKEVKNAPSIATSIPQAMPEQCPSPSPSPILKTKPKRDPSGFARFWEAYPKKLKRPKAEKAFEKVDPALLPKILEAIKQHAKSDQWQKDGGQYIPYPATWLNDKQWDDELTPSVQYKPVIPFIAADDPPKSDLIKAREAIQSAKAAMKSRAA